MRSKNNNKTKEKIISTTKDLLENIAYRDLTIQDIARAADMKHTVIYYYYKNKEDIAKDIYNEQFWMIIEKAKAVKYSNDHIKDKVRGFITYFQEELYKDNVYNDLFYELVDYSNFDEAHLKTIITMVRSGIEEMTDQPVLGLTDDRIKVTIMVWEASLKSIFKSIKNNTLNISFDEASEILIANVMLNLGFVKM